MRRSSLFKARDVTRAIKAVVAAGIEPDRVEIGADGKIAVITRVERDSEPRTDLDEWIKRHHATQA
jgi:hypothetical protein